MARGIKSDDFWNMTFFEYRMTRKNLELNEELEWQRTSLLAAILANQNRGKGKAAKPDDFNPYSKKSKSRKEVNSDIEGALAVAEQLRQRYQEDEPDERD